MSEQPLKKKRGRPVINIPTGEAVKGSQKKLRQGEDRYVSVLPITMIEDIKSIAYWLRCQQKDVSTKAFTEAIAAFKIEHPEYVQDGSIKPRPAGN